MASFIRLVAQRLNDRTGRSYSRLMVSLAIWSLILGVGISLLAFAITGGFRHSIRSKITGLRGEVQIRSYSMGGDGQYKPFNAGMLPLQELGRIPEVGLVQQVVEAPVLLKTGEAWEGLVFRGVDTLPSGGAVRLERGRFPHSQREVMISMIMSERLRLDTGQRAHLYYVEDPPRIRSVEVCGIFSTGVDELDRQFMLGKIDLARDLRGWDSSLVQSMVLFGSHTGTGFKGPDIGFKREKELMLSAQKLLDPTLYAEPMQDVYPQLYAWLDLLQMNARVIMILMLSVALINLISALLLMIMERTQQIGVFLSLGASRQKIQGIFFMQGINLSLKGLLWGNVLALALSLLQAWTGIFRLPEDSYYVREVPILIQPWLWIGLNGICLLVIALIIWLPVWYVSGMHPVKALKFLK